jgi:hypothetical protein
MKNSFKEIHVKVTRETANQFLSKCKANNSNGSKKIREWIADFLKGEKA